MADDEEKRHAAISIALEAGAVRVCEFHPGSLLTQEHEREHPYQRGNMRLNRGEFKGVFKSPAEMAEHVKAVIDEAMDFCHWPDCPE
jgi:hypothetical protein